MILASECRNCRCTTAGITNNSRVGEDTGIEETLAAMRAQVVLSAEVTGLVADIHLAAEK